MYLVEQITPEVHDELHTVVPTAGDARAIVRDLVDDEHLIRRLDGEAFGPWGVVRVGPVC